MIYYVVEFDYIKDEFYKYEVESIKTPLRFQSIETERYEIISKVDLDRVIYDKYIVSSSEFKYKILFDFITNLCKDEMSLWNLRLNKIRKGDTDENFIKLRKVST